MNITLKLFQEKTRNTDTSHWSNFSEDAAYKLLLGIQNLLGKGFYNSTVGENLMYARITGKEQYKESLFKFL